MGKFNTLSGPFIDLKNNSDGPFAMTSIYETLVGVANGAIDMNCGDYLYGSAGSISGATIGGWTNETWTEILSVTLPADGDYFVSFAGYASQTSGYTWGFLNMLTNSSDSGSDIGLRLKVDGTVKGQMIATIGATTGGVGLSFPLCGAGAIGSNVFSVSVPVLFAGGSVISYEGYRSGAIANGSLIYHFPMYWKKP